ncbi:hypothetical protein [Streptomyces luteireticuli]|uniref:hypothetical protein n=1 Tax=Streptomyces luteireticuli TaxID=173858 RepID=UPI003558F9CE
MTAQASVPSAVFRPQRGRAFAEAAALLSPFGAVMVMACCGERVLVLGVDSQQSLAGLPGTGL